ncbi:hypothetical protein JG687_00002902 [Phytophthora cactorum]|uniref:PhoD-like phosphatase metallophosphatase domain-containing protein n=1 Tax=Phytophthora cactorum TaxID=29920 RepID=A0A8T1UTQ1_9STRA|nr:hypothetical protein JG687_00002902 [Phytophthora cactorum]
MSREERKMAQIIASIERMEQETRASGDDSNRTQEASDWARQGGRGKKNKKAKASGFKGKPGKKLKVTAVAAGARAPFERKLTPKKRWIQLWSTQMDASKEKDSSSSSDELEAAAEKETLAVATSPVSEVKVSPAAPPAPLAIDEQTETAPEIPDKSEDVPTVAPSPKLKAEKEPAPVSITENKPQEQTTENQITETPKLTTPKAMITPKAANVAVSTSSELRVKTPLNNESSHLSPPLERNSPTTTASISPSAKVKDSDTPNNNTAAAAAAAAKFSPAACEQEMPVPEKKELSRKDSMPRLERKSSSSSSVDKGEDIYRRDTSDRYVDRGRKRSLELSEPPMSEEMKRRAERRRKRKSNWDVGDPRKGGSPVADPPVSAAAAAANQQSFAKYPSNRPSWRHSQSMMDMKPPFQSGHRSSSFYNSGASSGSRRGFYHSTTAVVAAQSITRDINDSLLLVVGDVTSSSARILYDQVPLSATKLSVHVHKTMATTQSALASSAATQTLDLLVTETTTFPRVIALRDLQPGRRYLVQFESDEPKQAAMVMFHTVRAQGDGETWTDRVVVVSCDRFVDDHDDVLMERIASDIEAHDDALGSSSVHFGTAHLGDQIYADAGELSIKIVPFPLKDMADDKRLRARYDAVLQQFRGIYRKTFGRKAAQRVLRVGAHWMLPDDHEIINNFNSELVQKAFEGPKNPLLSDSERERLVALQLHCRAGLQAYYEFQYQLYHDFPWDSVDFLEDALGDIIHTYPVYFAVELQQLQLLFLDVRFERSFFNQEEDQPKLVSDEQMRFLDGKLQSWSNEDESTAVVFSSMPLFFQSAFSAAIAHIVEHETYPGMADQRPGLEDLFQIFQAYNQQKSSPLIRLLVGGDLHMLAHSRVCGTEKTNSGCLDQLITSGVTNGSTSIQDPKLIPYYYFITQLTPVFEIAYSSPWYIEYDRVFLGRNYGILEFTSDGNFVWDQAVTEPYDEAYQRRVQSVIDASTPKVLGFMALLIALLNASIVMRCCTSRNPKREKMKTTKTQ